MRRKTEDGGEEPGLYTNRKTHSLAILSWLLLGSSERRDLEAEPSQPGYPVCLEAEGRQTVGCDAPDTPPSIIWDCGVSDVARAFLGSPDGGDVSCYWRPWSISCPEWVSMFTIAGLESVSGCRRTKGCLSDYFGVGRWSAIGLVDHTITEGVSVWGC